MVVHRSTGRLDDKHIRSANNITNLNKCFAVTELLDLGIRQRHIQVITYFLSYGRVGITAKDLHYVWHFQRLIPSKKMDDSVRTKLAGAEGFEPPHARIKTLCLTA